MNHFEEVNDLDNDGSSPDIFFRPGRARKVAKSGSQEWRNKLGLEPCPAMINRKVEIIDMKLVNDGFLFTFLM